MASEIDPTVIKDDQKVSKDDLRDQLTIARNEITALQNITSLPRQMMYNEALFDTL